MTRQEAIRHIRDVIAENNSIKPNFTIFEQEKEALYMAIEALQAKTEGDLISRQDAVNEIHKYFVEEIDKTPVAKDEDGDEVYTDMPSVRSLLACNKELSKRIKALPSAEPNLMEDGTLEVNVHDARLVKRVLIGDEKHWGGLYYPDAEPETEMVLCALADRTCPFQGEELAWCLTCPHISEEDRELVKKAVAEPKTGWIPIKWHEITEEEREREGYPKDWVVHIDCDMPCDGDEILVQTKNGYIRWDVCYEDGEFSLDSGWDWIEDIVAWQNLPVPYKGGDEG